jgi:molecular chaperone GrpE
LSEKKVKKSKPEDKLQSRIDELTGDLQRLQAEFINYKRREAEAKAEILNLAKRDVIMQLLPLLDNLDRALAHRPAELKDNAWATGVEQVAKQSQDTLAKLGVIKIESVGQPFDHDLHEAIGYEDGEGEEVVTEEMQPGYKMGDQVIRHAIVKVGKVK